MRVRSALLVPVLGLTLLGCSGEQPAAVPPPPSPSSPAAAAPLEVPASATPATPQGAANFARFYLEVLNRANASGEVEQLRSLSHPDCNTCREFIDIVLKDEAEDKRFEGGEYVVVFSEATENAPGDAIADITYERRASRTIDASGNVTTTPAGPRRTMQMRVLRNGDGWRAYGIRFIEGAS